MANVRLITPEDIARFTDVNDAIAELRKRVVPQVWDNPKGYKYKKYEKKLTLCHGIADLHPYDVVLPDAPPIEQFINYGLEPSAQVFQRIKIPDEIIDLDKKVKYGSLKRQEAIKHIEASEELTAFIETTWLKRLTGDWQLINGVPTNIPPTYWHYLNFWYMDIGLPQFRSDHYHHCGDLQIHYAWDYLMIPSPYCYGINYLTQRRAGKTFILGNMIYEPISRAYEWHGGLQSKTSEDAEKAFTKAIVKTWRREPFFFQPIFSNSTFPKKEGLQFSPRGKKGKNDAIESMDEQELMSSVTYAASSEMAYDGQKLHRYGSDESGKMVEADVYERWNIVKPCLWENDGTGNKVKGKAIFTTTVEEMEKKGGKYYKALFMDSDRNPEKAKPEDVTVDENGETRSGLWNWFTPSYCNELFDQYGISIVDTPTKEQQAYLKSRGDKNYSMGGLERVTKEIDKQPDQHKRQDIIRKKPRNIREAFQSATNFSHFNLDILNKVLHKYTMGYPRHERQSMYFGKFEWVNGVFGGDVEFVETDYANARFHASYFPAETERNMKVPVGNGKFKPAHSAKYRSGADPFKYDTPDVKYKKDMSTAGQHIYAFYDELVDGGKPRDQWQTNNIVYEYYYRAQSVDEMCEDYLKACVFYSCKLYPERNNDDVIKYFKDKKFEHYIQLGLRLTTSEGGIYYKQEITGGNVTGDKTIEKLFRHVQNFVNEDALYCKFFRTIQDVKDVERDNLNPFDLFVSLGYTLMSAYEADIANKQVEKPAMLSREVLEAVYERDWNDFN